MTKIPSLMRSLVTLLFFIPLVSLSQTFSPSTIVGVNGTFGSTSVADYDNDGNDDLLVAGNQWNAPSLHLYKISNGNFTEVFGTGLPEEAGDAKWINYNSDKYPDAYVIDNSQYASKVTFYVSTNGTFSPKPVLLPKLGYANFSIIDYDKDGDVDILMAGQDGTTTQTYLYQNNSGTFSKVSTALKASTESSIAWADFDNDNDLDVVISTYSSSVLYQNSGGNFSVFKSDFPGSARGKISWADFDKDNDLDLFITGFSYAGSVAKIFVNNGDKTFSPYTGLSLPGTEQGFSQWIDFDKDGDLDLFHSGFSSSSGSNISQLYELKNGSYSLITSLGLPSNGSFAFIDYDNDGDYDVFIPDDSFVSRMYRNNLKTNPYPIDNTPAWPSGLVAFPSSNSEIQLNWSDYANNETLFSVEMKIGSNGIFSEISVLPPNTTSYKVTSLTSGTVYSFRVRAGNASGYSKYSEIVISSPASTNLVKLPAIPTIYLLYCSSWADIDNDGDQDLIYSGEGDASVNYAPQTVILKNNAGVFTSQAHNLPPIAAYDLDWSDFDFDGDLDLLMSGSPANGQNAQTKILINNGNFNFTEYTQVSLRGVRSGFARWVDVNSDGYSDIFLSGTVDGNNSIHVSQLLINKKNNTFEEKLNSGLPTVYQSDVEIADFNKDGRQDFLINGIQDSLNYGFSASRLYLNIGDNNFSFTQSFQAGADGSVDASDLDGDGDLDIIVSGNTRATKIYWNDLHKFTEDTKNQIIGSQDGQLAIGDIDNDGDSDIIVGGTGRNATLKSTVYLNDGIGSFTEGYYPLTRLSRPVYSFGDYDNDGDVDLFEGGYYMQAYANIFKNQVPTLNAKPGTPSIVKADPLAASIKLIWSPGTDDKTPSKSLTGNVFVKDSNGKYLFNGIADPSTGILKTSKKGAFLNDSLILRGLDPGVYQVGVQSVDNSFSGSPFASKSVTISLVAPYLVSANPSACEGARATIEVLGTSVVWYKSQTLTDSIAAGNFFYPLLGKSDSTFYVVQKSGATKSPSISVTVKVYRQINGKIASSSDGLLAPDGTSYQWFRNDTLLIGATNKNIVTSTPGKYRLKISNGPCAVIDTLTYLLRPAVPQVTSTHQLCVNSSQQLSATGINIKWYNRSGAQVGTGNLFKIDKVTLADTVIQVTQTVNSVASLYNKIKWTVDVFPDSIVTVKNATITGPAASSYQWFKNGTEISGATNQELNITGEGVYYVKASNNVCMTTSEKTTILAVQDGDDVSLRQDIYNSQLVLKSNTKNFDQIAIYDATGKIILLQKNPSKSYDGYRIDVPGLATGLYILQAVSSSDSYVFRAKFVKNLL